MATIDDPNGMIRDRQLHLLLAEHKILVPRSSVRRGLAWAIAAELVRRHPGVCRVVEVHPYDYDLLAVHARDGQLGRPFTFGHWLLVVHLNQDMGGRLTPAWWHDTHQESSRLGWLEILLTEDVRQDIVLPLERGEGLPSPRQTPATTAESVGVLLLAAFARRVMFTPKPWVLMSGIEDGHDGFGVREWLFEQYPSIRQRIGPPSRSGTYLEGPEWQMWFVVEAESYRSVDPSRAAPHLAVDSMRGEAHTPDGRIVSIMSEYEAYGRSLESVVNKLCPPAY